MDNELVTVVLPIYNVEKYLNRCIESVVNQTYTNLEIILVDDGSPDKCPEICDKWAKKDSRIKVIHKQNEGLGMARNTGIENATGEYICFFDSDDYIALNVIEIAYRTISKDKSDVAIFGYSDVKRDGSIIASFIPKTDKNLYTGNEVIDYFLPNLIAPDLKTGKKTNLWMSAWASMFSMELIRSSKWIWVSERQIISEDIYSLLCLYKYVQSVSVINDVLYFYCENEISLTRTYRCDRYEKIKIFYDECINACDKLEYGEEIKRRLAYPYLSNVIAALKLVVKSKKSKNEKKKIIRQIITDNHLQTVLKSYSAKYENTAKRILITFMQKKWCGVVYLLLNLKTKSEA